MSWHFEGEEDAALYGVLPMNVEWKAWQTCRLPRKYVKEFTSILKRDWIRDTSAAAWVL